MMLILCGELASEFTRTSRSPAWADSATTSVRSAPGMGWVPLRMYLYTYTYTHTCMHLALREARAISEFESCRGTNFLRMQTSLSSAWVGSTKDAFLSMYSTDGCTVTAYGTIVTCVQRERMHPIYYSHTCACICVSRVIGFYDPVSFSPSLSSPSLPRRTAEATGS